MPAGFGRVIERPATTRDVVLEVLHRRARDRRALAASIRREHQPAVAGRGGFTKATRRRRVSDEAYRKLAEAEPESIASADRGADANGLGRTIGALNEYRDGKALIVHPQAMTSESDGRQRTVRLIGPGARGQSALPPSRWQPEGAASRPAPQLQGAPLNGLRSRVQWVHAARNDAPSSVAAARSSGSLHLGLKAAASEQRLQSSRRWRAQGRA
jgi:hypothetical protein